MSRSFKEWILSPSQDPQGPKGCFGWAIVAVIAIYFAIAAGLENRKPDNAMNVPDTRMPKEYWEEKLSLSERDQAIIKARKANNVRLRQSHTKRHRKYSKFSTREQENLEAEIEDIIDEKVDEKIDNFNSRY